MTYILDINFICKFIVLQVVLLLLLLLISSILGYHSLNVCLFMYEF